jgi:hypothetical protein
MTGENSLPIPESRLPPCELFTVLDTRKSETWPQCDVCDRPEAAHGNPGRRILSGGEIEALRRRLIVEMFDKLEAEHQSSTTDGAILASENGDRKLP